MIIICFYTDWFRFSARLTNAPWTFTRIIVASINVGAVIVFTYYQTGPNSKSKFRISIKINFTSCMQLTPFIRTLIFKILATIAITNMHFSRPWHTLIFTIVIWQILNWIHFHLVHNITLTLIVSLPHISL